jgi:hypothetical protein
MTILLLGAGLLVGLGIAIAIDTGIGRFKHWRWECKRKDPPCLH